jgi:hypothetical protein
MKNFWKKHFTNPNNKHLGWMFIPQNWYAGDKQQHTMRGMFFSVSYFILYHGLRHYKIELENWLCMLLMKQQIEQA